MTFRSGVVLIGSILILNGCGGSKDSASSDSSTSAPTASGASAQPTGGGTISGSVKFSGATPKRKRIKMSADAFCNTQHTGTVFADNVVVNANNTLKNVYVRIKSGLGNKSFAAPSQPAVLDQVGCIYVPHVIALQAGQELEIRNSDAVLHNVNARPKKNKPFNIGQPVKGMKAKKKFDNPELAIRVKCDVHPWMGGYVHVQNHPFASVTNGDGSYTIKNVPPGTYEIEAWHETFGTSVQKVTISGTETKKVQFSFKGA